MSKRLQATSSAPIRYCTYFPINCDRRYLPNYTPKHSAEVPRPIVYLGNPKPLQFVCFGAGFLVKLTCRRAARVLTCIDKTAGQLPKLSVAVEYQHHAVRSVRDDHSKQK